ncbi:MAG: hypothetical protein ACR2N9_10765 [Acidimicrobiia bacterium]
MRQRYGALGVVTLIIGLLVAAAPAHADTARVNFSVDEPFGSDAGVIVSSSLPNCGNGTVETVSASSRSIGAEGMRFRGTKVVHCDSGATLEFRYVATYRSCASPIDWGRWRVTGGTGVYDGARGGGFLVGNYTGGGGTACDSTGITDIWFGAVFLR